MCKDERHRESPVICVKLYFTLLLIEPVLLNGISPEVTPRAGSRQPGPARAPGRAGRCSVRMHEQLQPSSAQRAARACASLRLYGFTCTTLLLLAQLVLTHGAGAGSALAALAPLAAVWHPCRPLGCAAERCHGAGVPALVR